MGAARSGTPARPGTCDTCSANNLLDKRDAPTRGSLCSIGLINQGNVIPISPEKVSHDYVCTRHGMTSTTLSTTIDRDRPLQHNAQTLRERRRLAFIQAPTAQRRVESLADRGILDYECAARPGRPRGTRVSKLTTARKRAASSLAHSRVFASPIAFAFASSVSATLSPNRCYASAPSRF